MKPKVNDLVYIFSEERVGSITETAKLPIEYAVPTRTKKFYRIPNPSSSVRAQREWYRKLEFVLVSYK